MPYPHCEGGVIVVLEWQVTAERLRRRRRVSGKSVAKLPPLSVLHTAGQDDDPLNESPDGGNPRAAE